MFEALCFWVVCVSMSMRFLLVSYLKDEWLNICRIYGSIIVIVQFK